MREIFDLETITKCNLFLTDLIFLYTKLRLWKLENDLTTLTGFLYPVKAESRRWIKGFFCPVER